MNNIDGIPVIPWDRDKWIEKKRKLSDTVWLDGAILQCEKSDRVYIAPQPTEIGIFYEISVNDIVEVIETGQILKKLDVSYNIVRVHINKNSVIVRHQWMVAREIPEDARILHANASLIRQNIASEAITDIASRGASIFAGVPGDGLPRPEPSPSPSPERPQPGKGEGGGTAASGVRG